MTIFNLESLNVNIDVDKNSCCKNDKNILIPAKNDIILKKIRDTDVEDLILQVEKTTSILINKENIIIDSSNIPFLSINIENKKRKKLSDILQPDLYLFYNNIIKDIKNEYKINISINDTFYQLIFLPIKTNEEIYAVYIIQIPYSKIQKINI
jgi:hypothetical protein